LANEAPYTFDAGALFAKTKKVYADVVAQEEKAERTLRNGRSLIADAERRAKPDQQALLDEARQMEAQGLDLLYRVRLMRLQILAKSVHDLGNTLQRVKSQRAQIELGEKGLASFDAALNGMIQRYEKVYRPMFPLRPDGDVQLPDPTTIDEQYWDALYNRVEGPLFFWSPAECMERWIVAGVPACSGPDYLQGMSLVNQVFVATQNQVDIMREFPILSFVDQVVFSGNLEEGDEIIADIDDVLDQIKRLLAAILQIAVKGAEALAATPGWILVGGAAALFLLSRRGRR
jgi:hypothetical protein